MCTICISSVAIAYTIVYTMCVVCLDHAYTVCIPFVYHAYKVCSMGRPYVEHIQSLSGPCEAYEYL